MVVDRVDLVSFSEWVVNCRKTLKMTSGIVNENAEEKETMLEPEAVVEVLPGAVPEPPLYVRIGDVSRIELSKGVLSYLKFACGGG